MIKEWLNSRRENGFIMLLVVELLVALCSVWLGGWLAGWLVGWLVDVLFVYSSNQCLKLYSRYIQPSSLSINTLIGSWLIHKTFTRVHPWSGGSSKTVHNVLWWWWTLVTFLLVKTRETSDNDHHHHRHFVIYYLFSQSISIGRVRLTHQLIIKSNCQCLVSVPFHLVLEMLLLFICV